MFGYLCFLKRLFMLKIYLNKILLIKGEGNEFFLGCRFREVCNNVKEG